MLALRKLTIQMRETKASSLVRVFSNSSRLMGPKEGEKQVVGGAKEGPVKFTTSQANMNYNATRNFYGDDRDLPPSHNIVLAGSCILGIFYLIFLRDDIDADGGLKLIRPIHETIPSLAVPLLQSAIEENRRYGRDTRKLEKKLKEYLENPEKYGIERPRLKEN